MDRRVTPSKRVTSLTWGAPPTFKQVLTFTLASAAEKDKLCTTNIKLYLFVRVTVERATHGHAICDMLEKNSAEYLSISFSMSNFIASPDCYLIIQFKA